MDAQLFIKIGESYLGIVFILAAIVLLGSFTGLLFRRLKIPQVVGYIAAGILVGQSGLRIFGPSIIAALDPVNSIALALIGFLIGSELKAHTIKKYGRQFVSILLLESITPFFIVSILAGTAYYLVTKDAKTALALALLLGAISSATAPAATTDVLKENRTRGPVTTMVLGIVAMDDAVALILYTAAASVARNLLGEGGNFGVQVFRLFFEIAASVALGIFSGFLLSLLTRLAKTDEGRILSLSLGMLFLASALASLLGLDAILAAMSAGFFLTNASPLKSKSLFSLVEKYTPPIYVLFFVLVGAKLDIWQVSPILGIIALIYVVSRTIGKSIGSTLGAVISHAPEGVRRYLPYCLLSQAGVAIGLSIAAGSDFSDTIGPQIMLIITATTFIVQIIGPIFVKYGVTKAGECGLDITSEDLMKACQLSEVVVAGEKIVSENSCAIVSENDTVRSIIDSFGIHGNLNYVVRDKYGRLSGVISLEHLKSALRITEILDSLVAYDIMDMPEKTVTPEDTLADVLEAFDEYDQEALPIVSADGKALGIAERPTLDHYIHERILQAHIASEQLGNAP